MLPMLVWGKKVQIHQSLFGLLKIGHHPNHRLLLCQSPNQVGLGKPLQPHRGLGASI